MNQPLVDIIIPCYNYGRYLIGAIESALSQSYVPIKITIIDDASTDNTQEVAARYPDIEYLKNPKNLGLMKSLKRVLNYTSSPYFILLSADDELTSNCVEYLYNALKANPKSAFAYGQAQHFGLENRLYKSYPFSKLRLIHLANYISETALIKREIFNEIGGYNINMEIGQEDWDLWLSFVEHGYKGVYVPRPVFKYRIHDKSKNYNIINDKEKYKNNLQLIRKNHPKLYGPSFLLVHYPYMIYDIFRTKFNLND